MPGRVAASPAYDQPGELSLEVKYGWRFLLEMQMDKVRTMRRQNIEMRKTLRRRRRSRKKRKGRRPRSQEKRKRPAVPRNEV